MMNQYITVIDPGSSQLRVTLAQKLDGKVRLLATETCPVKDEIRRGMVQRVGDVGDRLHEALSRLQSNAHYPCRIEGVELGLNAYGMRTVPVELSRLMDSHQEVDEPLLESLRDEAYQKEELLEMEKFDCYEQDYVVDSYHTLNPLKERPMILKAMYKMLVYKPLINENLSEAMRWSGMENYRMKVGVLASAEAVISEEEKQKGVVVVDFGAETTGLCMYKNGVVRHVAVLPFGGRNIDLDLGQLDFSLEEAEQIKLEKGTALHYTVLNEKARKIDGSERNLSEDDKEINDIIVSRIEEIVENLSAQIRYGESQPSSLQAGIVITGGASNLKDLPELIHDRTRLKVRKGNASACLDADSQAYAERGEYARTIGLVLLSEAPNTATAKQPTSLFDDEEGFGEPEPSEPQPQPQPGSAQSSRKKPEDSSKSKKKDSEKRKISITLNLGDTVKNLFTQTIDTLSNDN